MSKPQFNCYIDESGDEGLSLKSKPWFILTTIIVNSNDEDHIRGFEDDCKRRIWFENNHTHAPAQIHFRQLTHSQKVGVARVLSEKPFVQIVAAFLKPKLAKESIFGINETFYRYATRYLVERISWYVDDRNGEANLIFSNRRNFKIRELIDYIMLLMKTETQVRKVFRSNNIRAKNPDTEELLRAADVSASAYGNALNPDEFGIINYQSANELKDHFYRYRNGKIWTYGFKAFPCTQLELESTHSHCSGWFK
jgi:hypothetical protein